jgi:hypothetical protein
LSSRPSMTSSILSWSIVSKAALMSILTKYRCGLSRQCQSGMSLEERARMSCATPGQLTYDHTGR